MIHHYASAHLTLFRANSRREVRELLGIRWISVERVLGFGGVASYSGITVWF